MVDVLALLHEGRWFNPQPNLLTNILYGVCMFCL